MVKDIIKLQETCETCRHEHQFSRNKRNGNCLYLEALTGEKTRISRFTRCQNYMQDTAKWREMKSSLET